MDIYLHAGQSEIDADDHRFQVAAAGRRFGKSFYAAIRLYAAGAEETKIRSDGSEIDLTNEVVYYVGPTFKQARENLWEVMMDIGQKAGVIAGVRANEGEIRLTNGRLIRFKGADDPNSLRGVGLHFVVMDEYAFMKPSAWEYVIRPALARAEGGALFIGTPDGKNHFYDMWVAASNGTDPKSGKPTTEWKAFQFGSKVNTHITKAEIEMLTEGMSDEARKQEVEASFSASGGRVFNMDMFPVVPMEHVVGEYVIAVDLAGFSSSEGRNKAMDVLDDHAICIALIHEKGWHIERIIHGKWDVRETALRIIKAWRDYGRCPVGIEKGIARNAVCGEDGQSGYLGDFMNKYGYFTVKPLTHGNQKKHDRVKWALQGRADKGEITLEPDTELPEEDKWIGKFLGQAVDFPNPLAHDDLVDAVAYIDQMAEDAYGWNIEVSDNWMPHDLEVGF
jgi:hypothetical protein